MSRYRAVYEFEYGPHGRLWVVLWQQYLNLYALAAICGVVIVDNKISSHFTLSVLIDLNR